MAHDEESGLDWASLLFGAPIPDSDVVCQLAHRASYATHDLTQWRLSLGQPAWLHWSVRMISPKVFAKHSERILLSPDGCWPHVVNMPAAQTCLAQGVALAWLDRLDFAHDPPNAQRQGAFYEQFPDTDSGCLNIWAWGLSLTAKALRLQMPEAKIGVIGHSRGGKAALLCAARDPQIDAVIANNSGTGGAASLRLAAEGAESLQALVSAFAHWFNAQAGDPAVQARLRVIDCTACWASIAPRPMLILQAQDDLWANPQGTRHAYLALQEHWPSNGTLRLIEREGGHPMLAQDWHQAALFMRHVFS